MLNRSRVCQLATSWINTPYRHQGRNKNGIDCVGLVINVGKELGALDFDIRDYGSQPDPDMIMRLCNDLLVPSNNPDIDGTILLFRWMHRPQHFAIKVPRGFIQVYQPDGKCRHVAFSDKWRNRLYAQFDYKGVD